MLGPLVVDTVDGLGPRDRVVLATLVVRGETSAPKELLADALYAAEPPPTWPKVVQGSIARLRKALGAGAIETSPYGYRLIVHEDELDSRNFERLLGRARDHLLTGDPDRATYVVTGALALWRGRALPDLEEWEPGRVEAERLDGLRMDAQELLIEAEIAAGRARACLEQARALVNEAPVRELRWGLWARALYQSGRQIEALQVLGRARTMLREELGLDPGADLAELEQAILRQDPELAGTDPVTASPVCPYRGLLPYEAGDAEAFYGRDADVTACLMRLRESGVLAVVGPSGAGKSSVVRAGVVATLARDGLTVVVTTPGTRPLDSLAALASRETGAVLVVDQAEELITLCDDPEERAAYVERLRAHPGPLVLAIRADRLGDLSADPGLARLIERGLYLLSRMDEDELRSVVEGPARNVGLRLEPGLVDLLVREVRGEPGALPLLSHALRQTWGRREGVTLTVDGYRQTGGIRKAVAQSAEELYDRLGEQEQQQLRSLFLRLVTPGEGGEATRRRLSRDQLTPNVAREGLVEALVIARLVSTDGDNLQIAHEALAREWPRLRGWLEEDVEGQRTFRHLAAAAVAWDEMDRPQSELYRGVRLGAAVEWRPSHWAELTDVERAFLDASTVQADQEQNAAREQLVVQRRHNRRLRLAVVATATGLVAALVAGILAVAAQRQSERDADAAESAAMVADSRRLGAQALVLAEPDVSLLLGVESVRRDDSIAARSTLYSVLGKAARLTGVARGPSGFESLAVSPDGRSVAVTSGTKGGLLTYDAATLENTGVRQDLGALGVEYTPDSRYLATAVGEIKDGFVDPDTASFELLDAATLQRTAVFGGLKPGSFVDDAIDFSADGRRLVAVAWSALENRAVEALVWDASRTGRPILRIPMPGIYGSAQLSPDGDLLYLAQRDTEMRVIEVATGRVVARRAPNFTGEVAQSLVLSPDGRSVATNDADGVVLRDAAGLRPEYVLSGVAEGVSSLAFSRDGRRLAAGYVDGGAVVWDLAKRKPMESVRGHSQEVNALRFSPDGESLYTVSWDGKLLAWDLDGSRGFPPWRRFATNPNAQNPYLALPSPDGRTIAYVAYGNGHNELRFRDLETGRLTQRQVLPHDGVPEAVWSPDSRRFLTGGVANSPATRPPEGEKRVLMLWDAVSGKLLRQDLDSGVGVARFIRDGKAVLATTHPDVGLQVLDAETLQPQGAPIDLGAADLDLISPWVVFPDERHVVLVGEYTNDGVVVDLVDRTITPTTFPSPPLDMALSPDGERLAVVDGAGKWGVLEAASLTASRLRWTVSRRPLKSNFVWHIYWSADGEQLITTAAGTIDLWDAETLARVGNLKAGIQEDVANVQPMSDGHTLMIGRPTGPVLTWDLRPEKLVELACSLAGRNLTREEWQEFIGARPYRHSCPS